MKGGKFVVIRLKELIKTTVFAILGVIIIIGFIWFFLNLGDEKASNVWNESNIISSRVQKYKDGAYYTKVDLGDENAMIKVEVLGGEIHDIKLDTFSDSAMVFYPLLEPAVEEVAKEVIKSQSFNVSISNQNAYSAQAVLQGVVIALEQALED